MIFRRIAQFRFNNNLYQMFSNKKNKVAFLRIENGLYHYPTIEEFKNLLYYFESDHYDTRAFYKDDRKKKYKFTPFLLNKKDNKIKKVMLTSLLVMSCLSGCGNTNGGSSYYYEYQPLDIEVSDNSDVSNDYSIKEYTNGFYETEDFELLESSKMVTLYNNKYFEELFGCNNVGIDTVIESINSNKTMPDDIAYFITQYVTVMADYYKDLDFRVFNYNIKTVEVEVRPVDDVDFVSEGSVAFYDIDNNKLIISKDIDLANDAKSRLIFRHELGHVFNHLRMNKDGYSIEYGFNDAGRGKYLKEALTVIFTTDPFMYEYEPLAIENPELTTNMGYPITTNIVRVLVECSDYNVEKSITNNVYYFQNHLNEYYQDEIDASVIEELLEIQWMEYSDDLIQVNDEDYEDLYEYVTKVFIKKYINPSMSYNEIKELQADLEVKLLLGVSHDEYVYIDTVEEVFDNYILENNIPKTPTKNL